MRGGGKRREENKNCFSFFKQLEMQKNEEISMTATSIFYSLQLYIMPEDYIRESSHTNLCFQNKVNYTNQISYANHSKSVTDTYELQNNPLHSLFSCIR